MTTIRGIDVANFFIDIINSDEEGSVTNLQLNKIVFFAQAWSLVLKNKPLFEQNISYETHKIFYEYTSTKYHKYIFNLLNTLCKRSPYENFVHIFHLSLCFIFKFLYQCENTQHLSNIDLVILNCFSLGIKSLTKQKLFPSINRLKKIYEEKYKTYNKKEIIEGEVICLKLLNYDINILTPLKLLYHIIFLLLQKKIHLGKIL